MREKKSRLMNAHLLGAIAALKHTEYLVVCDPGLPLPENAKVIDLSLVAGVPGFIQTLNAVLEELVVEAYIIAEELASKSPELHETLLQKMGAVPNSTVPHETFKALCGKAKALVVTGETTPYANIILVGGVPF